jgi:hypothetical protein
VVERAGRPRGASTLTPLFPAKAGIQAEFKNKAPMERSVGASSYGLLAEAAGYPKPYRLQHSRRET